MSMLFCVYITFNLKHMQYTLFTDTKKMAAYTSLLNLLQSTYSFLNIYSSKNSKYLEVTGNSFLPYLTVASLHPESHVLGSKH